MSSCWFCLLLIIVDGHAIDCCLYWYLIVIKFTTICNLVSLVFIMWSSIYIVIDCWVDIMTVMGMYFLWVTLDVVIAFILPMYYQHCDYWSYSCFYFYLSFLSFENNNVQNVVMSCRYLNVMLIDYYPWYYHWRYPFCYLYYFCSKCF